MTKLRRLDRERLFERISEPALGAPYLVQVSGRAISQDLCNSIQEYYRVTSCLPEQSRPLRCLEIGAGYGRLAYGVMNARPGSKYWIVDIPPALSIALRYLKAVFPSLRIFKFRPFKEYRNVADEIEEADIAFFTANQIELLPRKKIDLAFCISNLHEMTLQQIHHYIDQIDRLSTGFFYTKHGNKSIAHHNSFTIRRDEYPFKARWHKEFNRKHDIQSWFFKALYHC